jgi:hypothetical protein
MISSDLTFEEGARRILQRELQTHVVLNDDGRSDALYDLRVGDPQTPSIAVECTAALDPVRTETWNVGPARGPLSLNLSRDWHVVLKPNARVRRIRHNLERILQECERAGIDTFTPVDFHLKRAHPPLFQELDSLKIESVSAFREPGTGSVFLGMTGTGGAVDPTGSAVPAWVGDFLRESRNSDVLLKLAKSGASERHVFIGVSFCGVPWSVESYLGTRTDILPITSPHLPDPITAVWIMYGPRGVRWDGARWHFFNAVIPPAG